MRPKRLIVLAVTAFVGAALPGTAAAAQTVTLGPAVNMSSKSISCPTSGGTDCAYVDSTEPAGVIAAAPGDGTITTWRVAGFSGTAQLVVFQDNGDGTFAIVQRSAPQTENCVTVNLIECVPNSTTPYTFTTSLPIKSGQLIGLELTQLSTCSASGLQQTCTFIGTDPAGASSDSFNTTPATGASAKPDATGASGLLVNADETLTPTPTTRTVSLSLAPAKITAGGVETTTATAAITDQNGNPVSGDNVAIKSSDPAEKVGPVTGAGGGRYTATITASTTVGTPTITATDISDASAPAASATLTQAAPSIGVSVAASFIEADGSSTVNATVKLTGAQGEALPGQKVSLTTAGPANAGAVHDVGGGVYTATITAGRSAGIVTIRATDSSVSPAVSGVAKLSIRAAPHPPKKPCVVPKLAGKTVAAARRALRRAGCRLGKTTRRTSAKVHKGRVVASKPKSGAHRRRGTRVAVVVSRGRR